MDGAKHIHHYVPRRYLRSWSIKGDGAIAVRFNRGMARLTSVDGIAFEDGGYSYEPLTPEMLRSILCCRPRSNIVTDSMMRGLFLPMIVVPVLYRTLEDPADNDVIAMWRMIQEARLIDDSGAVQLENLRRAYYVDRSQFGRAMRDIQKEGYETMLCNIESNAWPILDSMIKGKLGWIANDKLAFRMFYYICSQRTRSPSFKKMMHCAADFANKELTLGGLYRRHILALDSAAILMSKRQQFAFRILKAEGNTEFITGDLPVIKFRTDVSKDYYFPLSPTRAFLFGPRRNFDHRNAELLRCDAGSVLLLNRAIMRDSAMQIYGTSEQVLNDV